MTMARRYAYVRVTHTYVDGNGKNVDVIGGLEILDNDSCDTLYFEMASAMSVHFKRFIGSALNDYAAAKEFERMVLLCWSRRSYFCEVERNEGRHVQVFQPAAGDWLSGI